MEIDFEVVFERGFHEFALVAAKEAVVDEDAHQAIADRAVKQCCSDGRIDAARKSADHLAGTDLLAESLDRFLYERAHRPGAGALADFVEEVVEDLLAAWGVRDFGVKLHAVERA